MSEQRNPLKPVSWLKIIYRDGTTETRPWGSKAEAIQDYSWTVGNPKVEHCEILDGEPERVHDR